MNTNTDQEMNIFQFNSGKGKEKVFWLKKTHFLNLKFTVKGAFVWVKGAVTGVTYIDNGFTIEKAREIWKQYIEQEWIEVKDKKEIKKLEMTLDINIYG